MVGVALASAISQCVSAGLILHALTKVQDCYVLDTKKLHLDPATTKSILGLGLPSGFQNAIFAIANLFIQAGSTPSTLSWSRATAPPPMPMP